MSKTVKLILIIVVIVALVVVGSTFISGPVDQNTSGLQSLNTGRTAAPLTQSATTNSTSVDTQQINREFVSMLLNLQSISLDDDIFSEPAFQALRDNTIRLNQPGNEGRSNPFAPIGIDVTNTSSFSSTSVESLQASLSASLQDAIVDDTDVSVEDVTISQTEANSTSTTPTTQNTTVDQSVNTTDTSSTSTGGLTDQQLQDLFLNLGGS